MAGLLDFLTDDERAAQQRALQAYAGQVGQQQARQEVWDALGQTLPAQIVKSIYQAARLPGDVYQGKVAPQSPEAIGRASDFAGAAITGSMPFAVRGALGSGGGKMVQPEVAAERKSATYPLEDRSLWYGDANYNQTGGKMVYMTPDEFLSKARPMKLDDVALENISDLKGHMQSGGKLDPLALYSSGKEDGRHRAYAAKELGIKQVPVLVWPVKKQDIERGLL